MLLPLPLRALNQPYGPSDPPPLSPSIFPLTLDQGDEQFSGLLLKLMAFSALFADQRIRSLHTCGGPDRSSEVMWCVWQQYDGAAHHPHKLLLNYNYSAQHRDMHLLFPLSASNMCVFQGWGAIWLPLTSSRSTIGQDSRSNKLLFTFFFFFF